MMDQNNMTIFYNLYKYRISTLTKDIEQTDNILKYFDKVSNVYFENIEYDKYREYIGDKSLKNHGATIFFNKAFFPEREIVPDTIQGKTYISRYIKKGLPLFYNEDDMKIYNSILYDIGNMTNENAEFYDFYHIEDYDNIDYEYWLIRMVNNICKDLNMNFNIFNRNIEPDHSKLLKIMATSREDLIKRYSGEVIDESIVLMNKKKRKEV